MECDICGEENEKVFCHCKKCMEMDEISGAMEVSYDKKYVYIHCYVCKSFVAKAKVNKLED